MREVQDFIVRILPTNPGRDRRNGNNKISTEGLQRCGSAFTFPSPNPTSPSLSVLFLHLSHILSLHSVVLHSSHPMVRLLHLYSETNCPRIFPVQCGKQQMEVCRGKAERTGPVVAVVPRLSLAAGSEFR